MLLNWTWRSLFPHAVATTLPIISSDHSPIIFRPRPKHKSGVSFKYEAYWEENEECREVIKEGWTKWNEDGEPWEVFLQRSKECKKSLQAWHQRTFKRADEEIIKLKKELSYLISQPSASTNWEEVKNLKDYIARL